MTIFFNIFLQRVTNFQKFRSSLHQRIWQWMLLILLPNIHHASTIPEIWMTELPDSLCLVKRVPQMSKYRHAWSWPFRCWGYFHPKHKDATIFENHLNPVILVFIGKLSMSTVRWVPMSQGFSHFSGFFASFCICQISHQHHMG